MAARRLVFLAALLGAASCTYDPGFSGVSCDQEGATEPGRECRDGLWVATGSTGDDGDSPDGGGLDGGTDDDSGCVPETPQEFCDRLGFTCEVVNELDNCGNAVSHNCGDCTGDAICGGGGTDNVCACPDQTDQAFCDFYGAQCDPYTDIDECGAERTVNCGTCADLLSCGDDNTCACDEPAACTELQANCGEVDVTGMCGNVDAIQCGTCDAENASCSAFNRCECDTGYVGDGQACMDVDECALDMDDCDPNADCTNLDGSFECTCQNGYTGNGKTCMPVSNNAIATDVQKVVVTLGDGEASGTSTLQAPVDSALSVPFATRRLTDAGDEADRLTIDVWLSADDTVNVSRQDSTGPTTVIVYVVEFDDTNTNIQSGTYNINDVSGSVPLPNAVDRSKSFMVFYGTNDNNTDDKADIMMAGDVHPAGTSVQFSRNRNSGRMEGHWWVVESDGNAFGVQHTGGNMAGSTEDFSLSSVQTAKSMLLYSYESTRDDDEPNRGFARCELTASTNVQCRRGSSSDDIENIRLQVVTFAGPELVWRGDVSFGADDGSETRNLPGVDRTSMAFGGHLGVVGVGSSDSGSGGESPGSFFSQEIVNNGNSIELRRGSPRDLGAQVCWQVVDW